MVASEKLPLLREEKEEEQSSENKLADQTSCFVTAPCCLCTVLVIVCVSMVVSWSRSSTPEKTSHVPPSHSPDALAAPQGSHQLAWQERGRPVPANSNVHEHDWADDPFDMPARLRANDAHKVNPTKIEDYTKPSAFVPHSDEGNRAQESDSRQPSRTTDHTPAARPRAPFSAYKLKEQRRVQQQVMLTAHCSLQLDLNTFCGGVITAALGAEQERIQKEISQHLPPWVQGVSLQYENGYLVAKPIVKVASLRAHALFGQHPNQRLRCTFEALMRSRKVQGATKLLSQYSGGLCSAKAGAPHCVTQHSAYDMECDPIGDVLIPDP